MARAARSFLGCFANLICFLLNKGRSVTRFAAPSKVKSGATNAPDRSCRAGTPTTTNNKPTRTAGGQRPEITTEG